MAGLYIHVPFCARKCAYCDFYSVPLTADDSPSAGNITGRFFQALEKELSVLPRDFAPDTIFIGGGTPTVLPADQLEELLNVIQRRVRLDAVREWTCEANPGTLDAAKATMLRAAGVNRVSLGVQTLHDDALRRLGRIHSAADAQASFALLRRAGFDNLGVDLMYALPGETTEQALQDVRGLLAWGPEHIACYALAIEAGTPLAEQCARGEWREVSDEEQAEQYYALRHELLAKGWEHYEISNFARPMRECRHNLNYWRGGEYVGCGPAAHGHLAGRRFANIASLDAYCSQIDAGGSPRDFEEQLAPEAKARETLIMALRLLAGVNLTSFQHQSGFDARVFNPAALERLQAEGLLELMGENLRLTEQGLFVSNKVFIEFV